MSTSLMGQLSIGVHTPTAPPAAAGTFTSASAVAPGAAAAVATTWYVPCCAGAVYNPPAVTCPPAASRTDQRQLASATPTTVQVSCCLAWGVRVTSAGVTVTVTPASGALWP